MATPERSSISARTKAIVSERRNRHTRLTFVRNPPSLKFPTAWRREDVNLIPKPLKRRLVIMARMAAGKPGLAGQAQTAA